MGNADSRNSARNGPLNQRMRFSRNQLIGAFLLMALLWSVILYRMIFSGA